MSYALKFEICQEGNEIRRIVTDEQHVTIGRNIDSTLHVEDGDLDDLHTVVMQRDDGMIILLNYSKGCGTLLNGEPADSAIVREGDVFRCGKTTFRLLERMDRGHHRRPHLSQLPRAFRNRIVDALRHGLGNDSRLRAAYAVLRGRGSERR